MKAIGPRLRDDVIVREIDGDFAVYDPLADRTALLSPSAAAILFLCDGKRSVSQILVKIRALFPGVPLNAATQVEDTISELIGLGFVERSE